jgi:hypothetical protein
MPFGEHPVKKFSTSSSRRREKNPRFVSIVHFVSVWVTSLGAVRNLGL